MSNASQNRDFRIRLKAARQGAGFTLGDLADELEACGKDISLDTITAWENAENLRRSKRS